MALPDFVLGLYIGKNVPKEVDRSLMDALQEVEVNQSDDDGLGFPQGFRITFAAERSADQRPEYALLQNPLLQPGNRLIVTVALVAKPSVLIDGVITHQQLTFHSGNGDASITIMGRDLSIMLDLEEKVVSHKQMKHRGIVENILKQYAALGIQADVKAPATPWPQQPLDHGPLQVGTDRAYLRTLAAVNGFVFYLKAGPQPGKSVAYWGPRVRTGESQTALTVNMGTATNVEALHFAFDALAPSHIVTAVADPNDDKAAAVAIQQSKQTPTLVKTAAFSKDNPLVRTQRLPFGGADLVEARGRAQALADRSTDLVAVGAGTLDAVAYGAILMAPGLVGVRGAGVQYDGLYYVKAVKHRITPATYKEEFTITREGIGSTTKQVKP
ncbi:MAG: hypothetical protein U0350_11120 [Caldilineaceae bacterium]